VLRRPVWIEQLFQELRYGLRLLHQNPSFALIAILTLALGIDVNTPVFSVMNTVLLRPLPYPDAQRLVAFTEGLSRSKAEHFKPGIAAADFWHRRAQAKSFGDAGQIRIAFVAGDFWALTGARPVLGHLFGIAAGVAAALVLTRLMTSLLYDVRAGDPATFAVVASILAITALLASWGPALRAAAVDPLTALRCE